MRLSFFIVAFTCLSVGYAVAQSAAISLGTASFDRTQQVEVTSDELSIDQSSGEAIFDGNVLVVQGEVRLSAGRVAVEYSQNDDAASGIDRLLASGGVTFVTPSDAIEANQAAYSVTDGTVILTGDVILTQGQNAISGDKLSVDLATGNGKIEGRVRTIFNAGGDN